MIEDAKFSGDYFYINLNIQADFQICNSVPLNQPLQDIAQNYDDDLIIMILTSLSLHQ